MGKQSMTELDVEKIKPKVLFFTSTSGAGHNVVAANVKAKFEENGFETKTIDLFAHDPKIVSLISGFGFRLMFMFPKLLNLIWSGLKKKETGLYDRLIKKVKDYIIPQINEFGPDIIVSSHVAGQILTFGYEAEIVKPFRDYFIITDYEIPPTMKPLRGEQSFIVVPTEDFKKELEGKGYNGDQLLPYGIPINEKFYKTLDRGEVITRLGLSDFDKDMPTVLVMGGGNGLGKIIGVVGRLARNPRIQIIVVCGRNEELKAKIDRIIAGNLVSGKPCARIYNFGFCTNIEELMTVAHFSVGKTGGISSTEAVAKGLQIISFRQIPNPELANLIYLEGKGLARGVDNVKQLEGCVSVMPEKCGGRDVLVSHSAEKIAEHALQAELYLPIK